MCTHEGQCSLQVAAPAAGSVTVFEVGLRHRLCPAAPAHCSRFVGGSSQSLNPKSKRSQRTHPHRLAGSSLQVSLVHRGVFIMGLRLWRVDGPRRLRIPTQTFMVTQTSA